MTDRRPPRHSKKQTNVDNRPESGLNLSNSISNDNSLQSSRSKGKNGVRKQPRSLRNVMASPGAKTSTPSKTKEKDSIDINPLVYEKEERKETIETTSV